MPRGVTPLLLLFYVGCAHPTANFTSACGVDLYGSHRTAEFQAAEDAALAAFATHRPEWTHEYTCTRLEVFSVVVRGEDAGSWVDKASSGVPREVVGLCWCDWGVIELATDDFRALGHEYAHAIERCSDPNHEQWEANGTQAAVDAAVEYDPAYDSGVPY